jgi:PAS domain S-box-containing protein
MKSDIESMDNKTTIIDFVYNSKIPFSDKIYEQVKQQSGRLILPPLKIMALLIAISGLFAMLFEVRYFSEYSLEVYFTRLSATLIAFLVLVTLYTKYGMRRPIMLVHILLLTIIISTGYMIFLLPSTLIINAQLVGLMIFTAALFLSWDIKNQIIVAIYYNIVFAAAILMNNKSIYFLPNMYESVLFVLFLSIISVIGSSVNFKLRMLVAHKSFSVAQSEKKYRAIFNNTVEGLFQSRLEGKFITVNKALVEILGYKSEEELMKADITRDIYKSPEDRLRLLQELKVKNEIRNYRLTLKRKDGSDIYVRLNDRLIKDDEMGIYCEGNMQDITEQVKAEEERKNVEKALRTEKAKSDLLAKEATKSSLIKSQFLANMSHEIRTPMNGIIGYLSLLEMEAFEDEKEMNQFVSSAKQSAESLLDIINDLLDLSKIEAGKLELDEIDFNLSQVIDDSVSMVLTKAKEKNLEISKEISDYTPLMLRGDNKRIKQIFTNLLGNAVKFTEKGSVKIFIKGKILDDGLCEITASVKDTGIGIPENKMDILFKPFSQVDSSSTKKHEGTGLGLVICKEFIKMMEGDIWVESRLGQGTQIHFNVKLKLQENYSYGITSNESRGYDLPVNENFRKASEVPDVIKNKRAGFNILLVEDNLINQKVTIKILNDAGYSCDTVNDGKEGLEAVIKNNYDIVLMDVQMPEMDGIKATLEIRKLKGSKSKVPIIAITAHALMGDRERCLSAGMDEYITKPINSEILIKTMDKLLNIRPANGKQNAGKSTFKPEFTGDVFNFLQLEKISMDDETFQKEIISSYIEDVHLRFQKIESYLSMWESDKIVIEAHTIKGASFSIGAKKIGDEALALETFAKQGDLEGIHEGIKNLKEAMEETRDVLTEFLQVA